MMTDYTLTIYCFVDDFLKVSCPKADSRRKVSDAEIITTVVLACRYFHGNFVSARTYMEDHQGMRAMDKSNFNRHLHRLSETITGIFWGLGQTIKELNLKSNYIIDSFPVAVCKNIRIRRCRLLRHEAYRGYNSSKREYFYGFKVTVITTAAGIPVECFIAGGSFHDGTIFQSMNIDLPSGSTLFGDSAYLNYELEDLYKEFDFVDLMIERKSNSKRVDSPATKFIKKVMRKRVETTFSEITGFFPKTIHAVTPQGFLLKVTLFVLAYTFSNIIE